MMIGSTVVRFRAMSDRCAKHEQALDISPAEKAEI